MAGVVPGEVVERLVENTPEELRRRRQWVVRKGKVPYNARTGSKASSTDSESWGTFDEAARAFEGGGYDGLGFVFGSGDPYAGVDLDGCRNPETGEPEAWAQGILDDLGGYAEASPSGTGVHIFVRGKAPNKKRGDVEAYSSERYFTVTGDALVIPGGPIPERQPELEALVRRHLADPDSGPSINGRWHRGASLGPLSDPLSDEEVIELCRCATNAPKFEALYDAGETAAYDGDDSDADLALLGILKFYTQDPPQLERIFGGSALGLRRKWRERPDYRRRTIDKALRGVTRTYALPEGTRAAVGGSGRNRVVPRELRERTGDLLRRADLAAAIEAGVPPPEVLVPEVLLAGKVHSIFSAGGTGKTYMMLHLVREVVETGKPVLIFDLENGLRIVAERLAQLGIAPQLARELVHYFPFPSVPLGREATEDFERLLDEVEPALVVFDSWVNCLAACGLDENSAVDIATWADAYAQKARMRDLAVLILDHVPKEGTGARGSGRKRDYVDVMWELRNPQKFDRETLGRIDLHLRKDREGWLPPALTFSVGNGREGFVFRKGHRPTAPEDEAGLSAKEQSTLEALEALESTGASDSEWKDEAGKRNVARSTYYNACRRLLDLNLVEKKAGKYFVKYPQNLGPDESNGLRMDDAGGTVQCGPGGLDPGPTGPPVDKTTEHKPDCLCESCLPL